MALPNVVNTGKGYQDDVAYIHDVGFGGFAKKAGPGLLELLRQNGVSNGLVVDLGCGSGIWAQDLSAAGYQVLGVDISPAMIDLARKKAPKAKFINDSLLRVKLPPCDAVTSMGECVNYLFDSNNTPKELVRFFGRVYKALRPGGVFIFDLAEPGRGRQTGSRVRNSEGPDWAMLLEVDEEPKNQLLTRRMTAFRKVGTLYRRSTETHRLQLYRAGYIATELRKVGFTVRILRGYGAMQFPKAYAGFLARKS